MYVLSEIGTHKKIKRFVLCSSLFTLVYIYMLFVENYCILLQKQPVISLVPFNSN